MSAPETRRFPLGRTVGGLGLLAVLVAGLDKALLFRNLEYPGSDFYSFLEMTWSWFYAGRFLHDNAYGSHAAIHNFYLLPAFAPLTITLGAYGLIVVLVLAHGAAVGRLAGCGALDPPARLAVLAGSLGPLAFHVFDNPHWGFHPELLYPPLALLLALELLQGWTWRTVAVAGAHRARQGGRRPGVRGGGPRAHRLAGGSRAADLEGGSPARPAHRPRGAPGPRRRLPRREWRSSPS